MTREESFFGFHPVAFSDEIVQCINDYLWDALEGLEASLMRVTHSAGKENDGSEQVTQGWSNGELLQKGMNQLKCRLQSSADVNLDRLEIYVLRNILRIPSGLQGVDDAIDGEAATESERVPIMTAEPRDTIYTEDDEAAVDDRLAALRNQLCDIRRAQGRLRRERGRIRSDTRAFRERLRTGISGILALEQEPGASADDAIMKPLKAALEDAHRLDRLVSECRMQLEPARLEGETGISNELLQMTSKSNMSIDLLDIERAFQQHESDVSVEPSTSTRDMARLFHRSW